MRDIFSYLEHQFGKNAVKVPVYRQKTKNIERFFAERDLPCKIRDDEDLLWMSARQDALMQKEMLDEQLYRSIDSMRDYMPTLHYEEVNHLLLVDFKDVLKGLKHFEYDGSEIYLPCFSPEINARYVKTPALFTYPSYQYQLRHYQPLLQWELYGMQMIEAGFGMFSFIEKDLMSDRSILFLKAINRFYLMYNNQIEKVLCLPWNLKLDREQIQIFSHALLHGEQKAVLELLKTFEEIRPRLIKKLESMVD